MKVDFYVYSRLEKGASAKIFFKKSFEWPFAPPQKVGWMVPLLTIAEPGKNLLGEAVDVRIDAKRGDARVLLATEKSINYLRSYLPGDGWKEVTSLPD